ncbi:uncharacterized protein ISCGN_001572 [Ixodes scapularis]
MEDPLHVLVRNRKFTLLISDLTQSLQKVLPNTKHCAANLTEVDEVVNSLVRILDVAASYEGEPVQPDIDQLKHKLKVAIAELRNGCSEAPYTSSILSQALSASIQLLVALEKLERTSIEKAHHVAIQRIRAMESLDASQEGDIVPVLLEALRSVLPFLRGVQARTSSLSERGLYERLFDISAIQRFYLQFLADTLKLFVEHFNSRYMKILWYFCICQACQWLSKLCGAACGTSSQHALDGWMGAFVEKVDEALYRLSREVDETFFSAVDFVVGHGMSVGQLCKEDSREKLHLVCKEVLQVKLNLKNAVGQTPRDKLDDLQHHMKSSLENFEEVVNIALVELLVENYMKPSSSFSKLLESTRQCSMGEANSSAANKSDLLVGELNSFCSALDLTYSIAHLAAGCTTDVRSVSRLWNHLHLMESLDPELVAAVVSLGGDKDDALSKALGQLQCAWDYHVHNLFKSLLLMTDHEAFFSCLDSSIKSSIAVLADGSLDESGLASVTGDVASRVGSAADLAALSFEGKSLPDSLQTAVEHLLVARNALKSTPADKALKRAKVVRGCVKRVQEELNVHLESVSVTSSSCASRLIRGITTINATVNATSTASGDQTPVCHHEGTPPLDLDLTVLLEGMQSTRVDEPSVREETLRGTPGHCPPELSFRALHRNVPEILSRVKDSNRLAGQGIDSTASDAGWKHALQRSLWLSDRNSFRGASRGDGWIQNNSTIHTLVGEIEAIVTELCSGSKVLEGKEEVTAAAERLSQAGRRLSDEIVVMCSHLESVKENHKLHAEVERVQQEINFTARQLHLFTAIDEGSSANNVGVAPLARNLLLLAVEASRMLSILSTQHCRGNAEDKKAQIGLFPCLDHSISVVQNGSSSSA